MKKFFFSERVKAALDYSLSPLMSVKQKLRIGFTIQEALEMDINRWYGMLQVGNWYDVVQQALQEPLEEYATRDGTPPLVT